MKSLNSLLNFLIFALIAVFVAVPAYLNRDRIQSWISSEETPASAVTTQTRSQRADQVVNKYMKEAVVESMSQDINVKKSMLEFQAKLAEDEKKRNKQQEQENASVPAEKQIWKESDIKAMEAASPAPPPSSDGKMSAEEKAEYKRQFIENARRDGYEIELSDDLTVIKSTPIEGFVGAKNSAPESTPVRKPSKENDSIVTPPSD